MPDPTKKKPAQPDTTHLKRALDYDRSVRTRSIKERDADRADSTMLAEAARVGGSDWANAKAADADRKMAADLGKKAAKADSVIAQSAAKIGANQAALDKARKYKTKAEWRKAMGLP
jgi:hypothetical protein